MHREIESIILNETKKISKIADGERFFDIMDEFITKNESIVRLAFTFFKKNETIVLTGGFGRSIADKIDSGDLPKRQYILFNGGIRTGLEPAIIRKSCNITSEYIFFDDSIYAGDTYFKIRSKLSSIQRCFVVYDGSPNKISGVDSFFRYYDHLDHR